MIWRMHLRIGTWNMQGQSSLDHDFLLNREQCDVWLLTEVSEKIKMPWYVSRLSRASSAKGVRWAGVAVLGSEEPARHSDPHPASVAVTWRGISLVSSVLPWNAAGAAWPWPGENTADKTRIALDELSLGLWGDSVVWGGDWNNGLEGPHTGASRKGRELIVAEVERLGLMVPTKVLPHRKGGLRSIDHIAVPGRWTVEAVRRVPADVDGQVLSDHDAYVIDVETETAR